MYILFINICNDQRNELYPKVNQEYGIRVEVAKFWVGMETVLFPPISTYDRHANLSFNNQIWYIHGN